MVLCCVFAAVSVTMLTAGGRSESQVTGNRRFEGVVLNWATHTSNIPEQYLRDVISIWEEETGGRVELSIFPSQEIAPQVTLDEGAGINTYDMFTMNFPFIGQFVEAGQLLQLDPYLNNSQHRDADLQDFIPRLLEVYGQWEDGIYAYPLSADGRVFAYRTDLVNEDQLPTTWIEYIEFARQFHGTDLNGDGREDFGVALRIAGDTIAAGRWLEVFNGLGGTLLDDNWNPTLNTEEARAAIEVFLQLKQYAPVDTLSFDFSGYNDNYFSGRVPALIIWNSAASVALDPSTSQVADRTGFALVPGRRPLLGGWALAGLRSTKHPDAVYDFMTWFTSREGEQARWTEGRNVYPPTRISTLTDPVLSETRPFWPVLMENFQTAEALPRIPEAPELIQVLGEAIQRAINEELSPEEALAGAQRRWEQILRVSGRLR